MASQKWGEGPRRRRSPTNRGGLTFSRSQCDGHHSQGPQNRIFGLVLDALPTSRLTGVRSRGAIGHLGSCFPRFRALGPGAKRGPLADLPQREEKSAAPAPSSAGSGAALAMLRPAHAVSHRTWNSMCTRPRLRRAFRGLVKRAVGARPCACPYQTRPCAAPPGSGPPP